VDISIFTRPSYFRNLRMCLYPYFLIASALIGDIMNWRKFLASMTWSISVLVISALPMGRLPALLAAEPFDSTAFAGRKTSEECEIAGIKLCWCPPGRFVMGSPRNEPERRPGEDQVEVTLTKGFWMAKYETTQGQWKRIMGKLPGELTDELPEGDEFPVGNVNFAETEAFCQKLTELVHVSGDLPQDWEFRLPTEAQWEYACRAGTTTATSFGAGISSKQANFKGEQPYNGAEPGPSLNRAAKVGSYPASAWGLHDMHGNTFEWCRDWYHARLPGGTDPDLYSAEKSATKSEHGDRSRVRRGGCWADSGWPCRSAFRLRFEPERRYDHIGFRVVAVKP
jgi:formylglycine-generating enzyme required for sulfatase activity